MGHLDSRSHSSPRMRARSDGDISLFFFLFVFLGDSLLCWFVLRFSFLLSFLCACPWSLLPLVVVFPSRPLVRSPSSCLFSITLNTWYLIIGSSLDKFTATRSHASLLLQNIRTDCWFFTTSYVNMPTITREWMVVCMYMSGWLLQWFEHMCKCLECSSKKSTRVEERDRGRAMNMILFVVKPSRPHT